jgi:hypothetical protein
MTLYVGTSGYSYKEWKGSFYPEKISANEMLSYYASRLPAVELNNSYYRLPERSTFETWRRQTPENFRQPVGQDVCRATSASPPPTHLPLQVARSRKSSREMLFDTPPRFA